MVCAVGYSSDLTMVATSGTDGRVVVRERATDRIICSWPCSADDDGGSTSAIALSTEGNVAYNGPLLNSGHIIVRNARQGGAVVSDWCDEEIGQVLALAFSPDGMRIAAGGTFGRVRVYELAEVAEQKEPTLVKELAWSHSGPVQTIAFHPKGVSIASGGNDGRVAVHASRDGRKLCGWRHLGTVLSIDFAPDGKKVASCGEGDSKILVRDPNTGLPIYDWTCAGFRKALNAFSATS